jgi:adenylate cyclase
MDQHDTTAVLFVDVSGSTRLYEIAGDKAAVATIEDCVNLFKRVADAGKGRVIKTIGDEVMAVFPSAEAATEAAIAMQYGVSQMNEVAGTALGIHIGLHCGPILERDGDVYGDTVNLAAHLVGLAAKGQIITSRLTADLFPPLLKSACRQLYAIKLKGKAQSVEICEVAWKGGEDSTLIAARTLLKAKPSKLWIRYRDVEIVLSGQRHSLSLGRDASAELVVRDKMASRLHGRIERRMDKFVLVDHSANGTYVEIDGEPEIRLRREEAILHGDGRIALGQPCANATEIVKFHLEA